jgi:hypothetical protein
MVGRIETIPQSRLARLRARILAMRFAPKLNVRLAAALAIIVVVAVIGGTILSQKPSVMVGPSPSASLAPSPTTRQATPATLRSSWTSVGTRVSPFQNGSHTVMVSSRLDIAIGAGDLHWPLRTDVLSVVSLVGPDSLEFRAVSTSPPEWNCQLGAAGTYRFGLSPVGQTLTLTLVSDSCAAREAILVGDWTRSDVGDLAPGRHVAPLFRPFTGGTSGQFSYAVPTGWVEDTECQSCFGLWVSDPVFPVIMVLSNVAPSTEDKNCGGTVPAAVGRTPSAVVAWLATVTGLVVTKPTPVTIGGLSGVMVDVSVAPSWIDPCTTPPSAGTDVSTFVDAGSGDVSATLGGKTRERYILLDRGDGQTLLIDVEAQDNATWTAVLAAAMPVVNTFEFTH